MLDTLLPDIVLTDEDACTKTTSWFLELATLNDATPNQAKEESQLDSAK